MPVDHLAAQPPERTAANALFFFRIYHSSRRVTSSGVVHLESSHTYSYGFSPGPGSFKHAAVPKQATAASRALQSRSLRSQLLCTGTEILCQSSQVTRWASV